MTNREKIEDIMKRASLFKEDFLEWLKKKDIADTEVLLIGLGDFIAEVIAKRSTKGKENEVLNQWMETLRLITKKKISEKETK